MVLAQSLISNWEWLDNFDFLFLALGLIQRVAMLLTRYGLGWCRFILAAIVHREFNLVTLALSNLFLSKIRGTFRWWRCRHCFLELILSRLFLWCAQLAHNGLSQSVTPIQAVFSKHFNKVSLVDSAGQVLLYLCCEGVKIFDSLVKVLDGRGD